MKETIFAVCAALLAAQLFAEAQTAVFTVETKDNSGEVRSETVAISVENRRVKFVWSREKVPFGTAYVKVTPDFATARTGEAGYWVFPDNTMGTFRMSEGRYLQEKQVFMPFVGMKTPRCAFVALVSGMQYSMSCLVEVRNGVYHESLLFNRYMDDVYEDIVIEYMFLEGDSADYSGMGRAYREYQLNRGSCCPMRTRLRNQPLLEYAVRNPEVRIRQAWKPVPSPVPEQVVRNEPPVRPVVTFERVTQIVDECIRQGVSGAEFCLVGWNVGGHDGRFPQLFPVEPSLGGEARLKDCVKYVQGKGFQIVGHSTFRDCYMIADTFDVEYVVEKNPDGTLRRGNTTYGGGRLYTMCPQRAYEKFCPKQCAEMATLGFRGLFYIDVATALPLFPCKDRRHPLNNGQRAIWERNIMRELRAVFGGSASEGAFDFCIGELDSALTVQWTEPFAPPKNKLIERYIPLWQIVYHGIVLSTPFRTTINCTANPDRRYMLKLAEFGGRPTYYWHSRFITAGKQPMGDIDLEATTDAKMCQGVAWIKEGCDEYARRSELQFYFMDQHCECAPGVFRITYSNGAKMYVNYNDVPVMADGVSVSAMDYKIVNRDHTSGR